MAGTMQQRKTISSSDRRGPMHAIAELALMRVDAAPFEETLRQVAELAKQSLASASEVSLTVMENHRPRTVVCTGQLAIDLDERQYDLEFGPCVAAAKTGQTIVVHHDAGDSPYRDFARVAARDGIRQVVAVGLPLGGNRAGALNIYSSADVPLQEEVLEDAQVFTAYAAVVINNVASYADAVNEVANLRVAMESRSVIEQAKGIIMASARCTADEAFDLLRQISQDQNIKLRGLAQALVDSLRR